MSLTHYLLLVPLSLLGGCYLGAKLKPSISKEKMPYYWIFIILLTLLSVLWLSPVAIILLYTCLIYLVVDGVSFLLKKLNLEHIKEVLNKFLFHGLTPILIAFIITVLGLINASHPIINEISIILSKDLSPTRIMLLTDLHLGTGTNQESVDEIVQEVNNHSIDLFLLGGDIFDEFTPSNLKDYFYQKMNEINTTLGSYYVEGNHDLLKEEVKNHLEENSVTVLEDDVLFLNNEFYLIGRKDKTDNPTPISSLIEEVNPNYPFILLDHEPSSKQEAKEEGIDLQLSGHTHAGQLFPMNFLLKQGTYNEGNYHLVVSRGYGNWGIPVRTASRNEMVLIEVKGQNEKDG